MPNIPTIPTPFDPALFRAHLDSLTKPLGSLGRLEDLATQLQTLGISTIRPAAWVFAADHGIAAEGVSAYPQEVTAQMVLNFLSGGAAINVLTTLHNIPLTVVNAGVATPLPHHPALRNTPIRPGTRNMLLEPALSPDDLEAAFTLGTLTAEEACTTSNLLAVGEMGIANTTSASALTAALTGCSPSEATGRGTGLTDEARALKIRILERILQRQASPHSTPMELLRHFGGLEIATMVAFMLRAASLRTAILADGFISTAAAALAVAINPGLQPWLFAGHQSQEPGHRILLHRLNLQPILQLDMRLGEGTGAVLAIPILTAALALYSRMATFQSAQVSTAHLL